jgi:peroxiredoxin (alkyl hydroperoxide reductase subunit C)
MVPALTDLSESRSTSHLDSSQKKLNSHFTNRTSFATDNEYILTNGVLYYADPFAGRFSADIPAGPISPQPEEAAMGEEMEVGCARPIGGPVGGSPETVETEKTATVKEVRSMIQVGRKAPDFAAPAYHQGKFVSVRLSEYLGKWVLICFYPGDFTFV